MLCSPARRDLISASLFDVKEHKAEFLNAIFIFFWGIVVFFCFWLIVLFSSGEDFFLFFIQYKENFIPATLSMPDLQRYPVNLTLIIESVEKTYRKLEKHNFLTRNHWCNKLRYLSELYMPLAGWINLFWKNLYIFRKNTYNPHNFQKKISTICTISENNRRISTIFKKTVQSIHFF